MASKALPGNSAARHSAAPVAVPAARIQAVSWQAFEAPESRLAWDALAQCAAEPNPFHESWYLLPALRALDPAGEVRVLRFEAGGELAGLLPVRHEKRYYRWPIRQLCTWIHGNCFLGAPLVARGLEREFWRAMLDWADRNAGGGLFLHLAQVPLEGPLHAALQAVLAEQGRLAALVHREERAMLASDLSAEAYFEASLSGKKRKELRRQFARLSEQGELTFERSTDDDRLARWIEDFLALEHSGWKGSQGSALASHQATTRLFKEALFGAASQGKLERLTLSLDGEPIAMLANFLTPPGAFSYKTAFDERFARFSPGVLVQRENLALLDRSEIAWCDSCAAADHPMIDHIWRERRAVGRISVAIGGKLRRALFARVVRAELGRNPAGI
ncbi:GNAT family N-acetyltransferase [Novosphingobium sp.]|uniref:GNAT family N-acetyltransferase n=1 Tax=Novosphingobium sp. TaxID=1874826 RepID=UPI003440EE8D